MIRDRTLTSIQPVTYVCFALCAGILLSLWQRRAVPGAATVLALSAAIWGAISLRILQGTGGYGLAVSLALLQFVPALFFKGVLDHLADEEDYNALYRRCVAAVSCGFAALALTSPYHQMFVSDQAGTTTYHWGAYAALGWAVVVSALGIYAALGKGDSRHQSPMRTLVFAGFPLTLLLCAVAGLMLRFEINGMSPVYYALAIVSAFGVWLLCRYEFGVEDDVRDLLFARLPDPVVALDNECRVLDCNAAFARLVEYPLDELQGNPLKDVISEANFAALTGGDANEFELGWQLADNVVEHYQVAAMAPENGSDARLYHLTESDSHRHAQEALETADLHLEQANASLDRLTLNDELTGLANQRRFIDELENEISRHQRSGLRFGVIAIEADHFNLLAEQHGEAFRDRSLALIARAIEVEVRDTDLCARLEGEEFAVLAVQMKVPGLVNLAERIRKRVLKVRPHAPGGERVRMSVSCGVGIFNPKEDDLRGLLARTDRYLAEAKRTGHNQVITGD